jgi:hypothetical protein
MVKRVYNFSFSENVKGRQHLELLNLDDKLILKWIANTQYPIVRVCLLDGFVCVRIWTSGEFFWKK